MRIIESHAFALRSTSAAILMVLALWANPVRAQLAVSDSPVEANTTVIAGTLSGISNQQLPAIIAQDTITAQSLTTPGGAGRFQSQLSYLNSLMQTMGSGIAKHFQALEACNAASVSVLQAIQCGNEINLAAAQQTQQLRQLEITHIMVDAVHFGEQLNEDAQLGANAQTYFLTGAQQ